MVRKVQNFDPEAEIPAKSLTIEMNNFSTARDRREVTTEHACMKLGSPNRYNDVRYF